MSELFDFKPFPKLARLSREMVITEKLDGTNAQIFIAHRSEVPEEELSHADGSTRAPFLSVDDYIMLAGSRNRWISSTNDNYGFGRWVSDNREELVKLGPGQHFGEWWGAGIQRGYGLKEKRFSLFNVGRWFDPKHGVRAEDCNDKQEACPACCSVVPVLFNGTFSTALIENVLASLGAHGSYAAPGFSQPEGIIIYHTAAKVMFKKTFGPEDAGGKGEQ